MMVVDDVLCERAKRETTGALDFLPSPRTSGLILGLILGRNGGLICELRLCRLRDMPPPRDSGFFATGPLGDGMATVRGLGATEDVPGARSTIDPERGSIDGVTLADVAGLPTALWTREDDDGRDCARTSGLAASGSTMSSITSSCDSRDTSCAAPRNCPDGSCVCCARLRRMSVAGVAAALARDAAAAAADVAGGGGAAPGDFLLCCCGIAGGGISGSDNGSGDTESCPELSLLPYRRELPPLARTRVVADSSLSALSTSSDLSLSTVFFSDCGRTDGDGFPARPESVVLVDGRRRFRRRRPGEDGADVGGGADVGATLLVMSNGDCTNEAGSTP